MGKDLWRVENEGIEGKCAQCLQGADKYFLSGYIKDPWVCLAFSKPKSWQQWYLQNDTFASTSCAPKAKKMNLWMNRENAQWPVGKNLRKDVNLETAPIYRKYVSIHEKLHLFNLCHFMKSHTFSSNVYSIKSHTFSLYVFYEESFISK